MKAGIYTRGGDAGQTSLLGGMRVDKDDPRVEVYGTLDEATSALGLARATSRYNDICGLIIDLQGELIPMMSEIATLPGTQLKKGAIPHLQKERVEHLEQVIDLYNAEWIQTKHFTRPGGSQASAALDMARSICRRAERRLITSVAPKRSTPSCSSTLIACRICCTCSPELTSSARSSTSSQASLAYRLS